MNISGVLDTIDVAARYIRQGRFWTACGNATLANGEELELAIGAKALSGKLGRRVHLRWLVKTDAKATFAFVEDVGTPTGGASVTPTALNRSNVRSPDITGVMVGAPGATLTHGAGTTLKTELLSAGHNAGSVIDSLYTETILKPNAWSLVRLTAAENSCRATIVLHFYTTD